MYWTDRLSLRDELFELSVAHGHRQLTDLYLLGLAPTMGAVLATFDRTIPVRAGARRQAGHGRCHRLPR